MANVEYSYLSKELECLIGGRLDKFYELGEGEFRIRFRVPGKYEDLSVVLGERIHLTKYIKESPKTPTNLAMYIRKRISGAKLLSVEQHGFDRVLVFGFDGFTLVFEMFAKGNLVFLGDDNKIIRIYRREEWKDRVLKERHGYEFPKSNRASPPFSAKIKDVLEPKALIAVLSAKTNFGNTYLEEACMRSGLKPRINASKLDEKQISTLVLSLNDIYSKLKPIVYFKEGKAVDFSLADLCRYSDMDKREIDSLSKAIDMCISQGIDGLPLVDTETEKLRNRLEKQTEHREKLLKDAEDYRNMGDAIYARYNEVESILKKIKEMKKQGNSWDEIKKSLAGKCEIDEHNGRVLLL